MSREIQQLIPWVCQELEAAGAPIFSGQYNLNLFGLRNISATNEWNDWLGCLYQSTNNEWILVFAKGTTDPGLFYLQNPMNPNGTGILPNGVHRGLWKLGLHKGQYEAFVQAKAITIHRDDDRDNLIEITPEDNDTGWFGCNGHKNYRNNTEGVNKASALCQVWLDDRAFDRFLALARLQIKSKRGTTFSYTLIDLTNRQGELPSILKG
jgi:hypothetical protein